MDKAILEYMKRTADKNCAQNQIKIIPWLSNTSEEAKAVRSLNV